MVEDQDGERGNGEGWGKTGSVNDLNGDRYVLETGDRYVLETAYRV